MSEPRFQIQERNLFYYTLESDGTCNEALRGVLLFREHFFCSERTANAIKTGYKLQEPAS
jgi:hypothetical protein